MSIIPINKHTLYLAEVTICKDEQCDDYLMPLLKQVESIPKNVISTKFDYEACLYSDWTCNVIKSNVYYNVTFINPYGRCSFSSPTSTSLEYLEAPGNFRVTITSPNSKLYYKLGVGDNTRAIGKIPNTFIIVLNTDDIIKLGITNNVTGTYNGTITFTRFK
jgi:hypothetical protein